MPAKITNSHKSVKHQAIDQTNSRLFAAVAIATFVVIFCLFASKALIGQSFYHGRVIAAKDKALKQLKDNEKNLKALADSYATFQNQKNNILNGNAGGTGPLDGKNPDIVLDALPDTYDYPALSSSFEKILKEGGYEIGSIGGTEDPGLSAAAESATGDVKPIEIPYSFTVSSNSEGTKRLLTTLESSIRPMYVDTLQIQVSESVLQTRIGLRTFFTQPKTFQLGSETIK